MAWDFTGGLGAPKKEEEKKQVGWDFTGGISEPAPVKPPLTGMGQVRAVDVVPPTLPSIQESPAPKLSFWDKIRSSQDVAGTMPDMSEPPPREPEAPFDLGRTVGIGAYNAAKVPLNMLTLGKWKNWADELGDIVPVESFALGAPGQPQAPALPPMTVEQLEELMAPRNRAERIASFAGEMAGEAPFILGAYGLAGKGVKAAAGQVAARAPKLVEKLAPYAQFKPVAERVATGGAAGQVFGTAESIADGESLPGALKEGAKSAAFFGGADAAMYGLGKALRGVRNRDAKEFAEGAGEGLREVSDDLVRKADDSKLRPSRSGGVVEDIAGLGGVPVQPKPSPPKAIEMDVQEARAQIKSMDDVLKVQETPEGPTMLYSGVPAEKVAESVQKATQKLHDALGIPLKGGKVEVVPRAEAKQPGLLTPLKSPSMVAQKYVQAKPYVDDGIKATEVQERLRATFNKRLAVVDKVLSGGKNRLQDPLRATYAQNKADLYEILLTGDMMGKRFTPAELVSEFGANQEVIRSYNLIRSAYDHAHTVASRTRALRGKDPVAYREGYIPHFFSSWFISVDGKIVGSAKTLREAVAISNPVAREKGLNVKIFPKQHEFSGENMQAAILGDMNYFKLQQKIQQDFDISVAEAKELLEGVARMKGRSRFVGNFLQRKGVDGWDKNLDVVNRRYFNMVSRYAALDQFKSRSISRFERQFGSFDKDHTGIAKYIKDYVNDINGTPTAVEELINNSLAKVPGVSKFLGSYFGERPALQLASASTKAVAVAKLGLYNISSALVNASQLVNAYAKLGEKWTANGIRRAAKLSPTDRGLLKQMGVDVQLGIETGAGYSRAGLGDMFNKSMFAFQKVDNLLRRTTGLGAYYKGIGEGMNKQQAIDYAKKMIAKTQFDYSVADAPGFIRRSGPVGQVLFQFKKFPVKQMEFVSQLKGAENPRFWIPWVVIGGYFAFPGVELLKNSVKSMFDIDIELEGKKHLMQWAGKDEEKQKIAKTIMYGAFSHAGTDVTRRIGMGDFIPSEARDLAGPGLSTIVRVAQMAAQENWVETLRAISPAPGNIAVAMQKDGEISNPYDRDRLKVKLTPQERVVKAFGFMPISESIERDKKQIVGYSESRQKGMEQRLIDDFIKALSAGDRDKASQLVPRMKEAGITADRVKSEMEKKDTLPSARAVSNVPKKRLQDYKDIYQFK